MARVYRDNFSGGVNDLALSQIGETEVQDCRNLIVRGGVLKQCPEWKRLAATLPAGSSVKVGVARPDGTTVLVLYDATAGYTAHILNAAGDTLVPIGTVPGWMLDDGSVHGLWTARGTVLVSSVGGYWPAVVREGSDRRVTVVTLDSLDVRERGEDEYTVGIYTERNRCFFPRTATIAVETANRKDADPPHAFTATTAWLTIASTTSFNNVLLEFIGDVNGVIGELFFVQGRDPDEDPQTEATLERVAGFVTGTDARTMELEATWETSLAYTSSVNFKDESGTPIDGATVGVSRIRAVIRLTGLPAGGVLLRKVTVRNTQYVRGVCGNTSPHLVGLHGDRVVLALDNIVQFGPNRGLAGWEFDQEYFTGGGSRVTALQPHANFLAVFLEKAIYAVTGNSYREWGVERLADFSGTKEASATASDAGFLLYSDQQQRLTMLLAATDVRHVAAHYEARVSGLQTPPEGETVEAAIHAREDDSFFVVYRNARVTWNPNAPEDRTLDRYVCLIADPKMLRQEGRSSTWRCSLFPVDGPDSGAPITMSWSTRERLPVVVSGGRIWRYEDVPGTRAAREAWVTLPMYAGGDLSIGDVKRLTVHVSVDVSDDVEICFYSGEEVLSSVTWTGTQVDDALGTCWTTVPVWRSPVSACIRLGRRVCLDATLEYVTRVTGR